MNGNALIAPGVSDSDSPRVLSPYGKSEPLLLAAGYAPIPITLHTDVASWIKSPGKQPAPKAWQAPNDVRRAQWRRDHPNCGVGLLTRHTPAIDIDFLDKAIGDEVQALAKKMLGESPLLRIGKAPKRLLVYRTDQPFPKIKSRVVLAPNDSADSKGHAVEILGDGQQFVGFGIHPDTGNPYHWPNSTPFEISAQDLPAITEAQARAFIDAVDGLIAFLLIPAGWKYKVAPKADPKPDHVKERDGRKHANLHNGAKADKETVREALSHIIDDTYETWYKFAGALRSEFGDAGFDLFDEWSSRSSKYNAGEVRKKWEQAEGITGFGVGTVFWHAKQGGWRQSRQEQAYHYDRDTGEVFAAPTWSPDAAPEVFGKSPPNNGADALRRSNGAAPAQTPNPFDALVNPAHLAGIEPPPRQWIVNEWLPRGTATLLPGPGGIGKSLLAQQLQTATALGASFLGLDTTPCKSLAFYCEDDADELHRRGNSICYHYSAQMSDLGDIRWQGRFGKENVLATFEDGLLKVTPFFDFIVEAMERTGSELLILDNVAKLFGGNENDRSQVTQFVNKIGEIAVRFNAAVLLLAHPGKSETGLTSQYSGSTAWDASVRSRWMLERPKPDADQDPKELSDLRILRKGKANYSTIGDEIALKWEKGAFKVEGAQAFKDAVDRIEERNQDREDQERFLKCLDILTAQGKSASHASNTSNFAPKLMAKLEPWKGIPKARLRIQKAMDCLFNDGAILANQTVGRKSNRHPLVGISRPSPECARAASEPAPECARAEKPASEVRQSPSQPIDIIAPELRHGAAPERARATDNPLESLRQSCARAASRQSPIPPKGKTPLGPQRARGVSPEKDQHLTPHAEKTPPGSEMEI